ncbi:hypothetical protein Tsubulata_010806 [Turnera subulata]|uniref:Tetratricopeptide repeat protein 27 homolog n=1 Tax=Turnera subulata TaxID=218843 RepID=A0A9Q0J577_9ROSI|nr:hypothetical protein Tsubulata_010806 [Turnera subulata]
MAETEHQPHRDNLRRYELRLLRCTFAAPPSGSPPPPPPPHSQSNSHSLHSLIADLLNSIETGNYREALLSDAAELVFESPEFNADSPNQVYSELLDRVERFIENKSVDEEERGCRVILVMCLAVAAFFSFIQCNIAGPTINELPKCPLPFGVTEDREFRNWEDWARNQLMADGSDLLGKFSNLQYIVFAKMLVMRTKDLLFEGSVSSLYGIRSTSWWLARVLLIEQRILDELSSSLFDLLQVTMAETWDQFGSLEQVTSYWGTGLLDEDAHVIVSMVHLEAGIMEQTYGRVDMCRKHLESAEAAAGLRMYVSGSLGYRTVHQTEPKAQRVLVVETSSPCADVTNTSVTPGPQIENSAVAEGNMQLQEHKTPEVSDILMTTVLVQNGDKGGIKAQTSQNGGRSADLPLKAIQQAVILANCLLIEISSRQDELQRWDMAPYIETIDSQPSLFFMLRCFCDLLRIRWESSRSRTKERALGMMEKLVDCFHTSLPGVAERIPFCYVSNIPTIPAMRKEYGELLVSCGLVGEAIKIFEDLELWNNLIFCYCLLGKKAAAVQLIKMRLSETPNDPRLWCSLGDVTNDDSCYEKALEVSDNKSARAKRSLARNAYNRGEYEKSKLLWESAMALNSLYRDGWFALGAAALKARDVDKALVGFTQAVKLDPDNGEAWNNIACLHMLKKKSEEAFIAFREALKFKRDSWQIWEQYSNAAMDVGNFRQALEALQMVLNITRCKQIDAALLGRIMLEVESGHSVWPVTTDQGFGCQTCPSDSSDDPVKKSDLQVAKSHESEKLVELLGKILQQIVKTVSRADMWGLYARWHKLKGDLTMCSEALLKQVRSYQAENFSDTEEFKELQACLSEVKAKLQCDSVTS